MKKGMMLFVVATVSLLLLFNQCMFNDAESLYDRPALISSLKVYGMVNNIEGNPIAHVRIETENAMGQKIHTYTDSYGFFSFDQVRARDNRIVLEADMEGYFHKSFATSSLKNDAKVRFVMNRKSIAYMSANADKTVAVSDKASVHFEANSLVTQSGAAYEGSVVVAYTYADPQSPVFSLTMQGGDMRGINSNQQEQLLISYGALAIELTGSSGEPLALAPGKTATIEMTVSEEQLGKAPSTIPLWYFDDEKNVWIEDGYATLQGNKYIGQVSHFTWWNCDDSITPNTFVTGYVYNCDNTPLAGVAVSVGPMVVYTNSEGQYICNVASDLSFYVLISPSLNAGISLAQILVNSVPASTTKTLDDLIVPCSAFISGSIDNCDGFNSFVTISSAEYWPDFWPVSNNFKLTVGSGTNYFLNIRASNSQFSYLYQYNIPPIEFEQTYTLPSTIEVECPVTISGILVDCTQNPVNGLILASWDSITLSVAVPANGEFSFKAPANQEVSIKATHNIANSFVESAMTSAPPTPSSGSYTVPPIQFSCPSTLEGLVTSCIGNPVTTTVKLGWAGQVKNIPALGGSFTATVPGGQEISVSAQGYVGGGMYSGQTLVNSIYSEAVFVTLPLCTVELASPCSVSGVQVTGNGNTVNYPNLVSYITLSQISLLQTTTTPGVNLMTQYSIPSSYTLVYANEGSIGFSLILPQSLQPGTYNIGSFPIIAYGQRIGVMMIDNQTPTFILTQGQITISQVSGNMISGSFTGSAGTLPNVQQLASPILTDVSGDFCLTY
jgi:hypothetical protein